MQVDKIEFTFTLRMSDFRINLCQLLWIVLSLIWTMLVSLRGSGGGARVSRMPWRKSRAEVDAEALRRRSMTWGSAGAAMMDVYEVLDCLLAVI
jgi:hypothetical protein